MKQMLTVEQTAEKLQLNPQVVREYLRKGVLPGCKIGRHWRVVEEDLVSYIRRQVSGRQPQPQETEEDLPANVREWRALSQEEREKRLDSLMGKYAGGTRTVDDFLAEKHAETEEEERRLEERDRVSRAKPHGAKQRDSHL